MSLNQNIRWQPLTQTLTPGAGQTQSLGQLFGDANTLITNVGDTFRDEATQRAVLDIGKIKTNLALKEEQEGILDNISQQGRGINEAAVLDAYDKQYGANIDRAEAARQRNEAQAMRDATKQVDKYILGNKTSAELREIANTWDPNLPTKPLVDLFQTTKAREAAAASQAKEDAIKGIDLQLKLDDHQQKEFNNLVSEVTKLYPKAGTQETQADGSILRYPTIAEIMQNPEYRERIETIRNKGILGTAAGKGNTGGAVAAGTPLDNVMGNIKATETGGKGHRNSNGELTKSPAGALGVVQIMPTTAAKPGYGMKPIDLQNTTPEQQQAWATEYISKIGTQHNMSLPQAVAAYNAGPGRVSKDIAKAKKNGGDWYENLPQETRNYLPKVLGNNWRSQEGVSMESIVASSGGTQQTSGNSGPLGQTVAAPVTVKATAAQGGFDPAIIGTARNSLVEVAQARNTKRQIEIGAKPTAKDTSELNTWLKTEGYHQTSSLALGNDKNVLYALYSKDKDFQALPPAKKKEALMFASERMEEDQGPFGRNPMSNEMRNYLHKWIKTDQQNTKEIDRKDKLVKYNDIVEKAYVAARLQNPNVTREMLAKSIDPVMYKDLKAAGLLADKRPTY